MFNAITELIIALFDLLEAEGRTLRRAALTFCLSLIVMLAAGTLGLAGSGMVAWGFYLLILPHASPAVALGLSGMLCFALGGFVIWLVVQVFN